ncbi:MAG: hypothetical protein DRJ56_00255 [Thermoprotei archaeon]|nr:MAG: hypothetical protein DRJ56_08095 [Thermoprotei archaeon]RLE78333.1 MAG: hypothetical protein DRJ56_00255 [Thermoprotei archaeon]
MRSFIRSTIRVLKVTRKPTRDSFKLSLRVCFLATVLLGSIGFMVQLTASMLQMVAPPAIPREFVLYALIGVMVVIMAVIAYRRRRGA